MKEKSDLGLIGLGVMGENLALNMADKGFQVSLYNRDHPDRVNPVVKFLEGRGKGKSFVGTPTPQAFVDSIAAPRRIMLMVKAGAPVDSVMDQLILLLSPGDVIIDGGNSDFHDTERRVKLMEEKGLFFVGTGISGGEEGALKGPSVMPGGSPEAWPLVAPILQKIAAKNADGTPCCEWMGKGGAGHFVKMVHNGIEYGDMQLIAESYSMLRRLRKKENEEIAKIFEEWNHGDLNSYLMEISAAVLKFKDKDGTSLVDHILDAAGQKGTGKWTVIASLDEGDPLTLITQAVYARFMSALLDTRRQAAVLYSEDVNVGWEIAVNQVYAKDALYASKIVSYAQGFSLMRTASQRYGWNLDLAAIARIWRNGCIIRSRFLDNIAEAYRKDPELENLLFDEFFQKQITEALTGWRRMAAVSIISGIPLPCTCASVTYFDSLRTLHSSANLLQAQRDFFGAHTYERIDTPRGTFFHTDWTGHGGSTTSGSYTA